MDVTMRRDVDGSRGARRRDGAPPDDAGPRAARSLLAASVLAGLALLAGCGGGDMTGPNGNGTVGLDLEVGESSVVTGGSQGLTFAIPGPGSSGAGYRLAVQSGSSSGTGPVSMQLVIDAGDNSSSSSSVSAHRALRDNFDDREISRELTGLELRSRLQRNAREMLVRHGIQPSKGYSPGQVRSSMLPTGEVPQEGDTLRFWLPVSEDLRLDCDTTEAAKVTGYIRAVGESVAMVEDSEVDLTATERMNMDYQGLANAFDDVVFGTDVAYFGSPTDIDGNQRVLVLFTNQVNQISAAQQGEGFIGGFFLPTDLSNSGDEDKDGAPATFGGQNDSDPNDEVCDASNEAEVMWLLAPDPDGSTGEQVSVDQARRSARSTSSHEFQHMLNSGNRFVKNASGTFSDGEHTWLDEGLSHIAEEIVGLKTTGKSLRQNLTAQDVLGNDAEVDAFNTFLANNFHNAAQFLDEPNDTRALAFSDTSSISESLKMRGFAWIFLRWLADQEAPASGGGADGLPGSGEELMFQALAGADGGLDAGVNNIEAATGKDWESLLADFGLAMAVDDDVSAASDRQQVATWDLRNIYAELNRQSGKDPFDEPYPLTITPHGFSTDTLKIEVRPGGGRYVELESTGSGPDLRLEVTDQTGEPLGTGSPQVTIIRVR